MAPQTTRKPSSPPWTGPCFGEQYNRERPRKAVRSEVMPNQLPGGDSYPQARESTLSKRPRFFYALGPGDVVDSYHKWSAGIEYTSETQLTLSGQFFDFCKAH